MRVLFAGNSYTMYNDVPAQVAAMAGEHGVELEPEMIAEGGASFRTHWEELGTPVWIRSRKPDVVVLQNRSTEALLERSDFMLFGEKLIAEAVGVGARVVLYETWAWHDEHAAYRDAWAKGNAAGWLGDVVAAYAELATREKTKLARVGQAWAQALRAHPEIRLHDNDGQHAAPPGSFLAACVLMGVLTGLDVTRCSYVPEEVEPAVASALRGVAASFAD